MVSGAAPYDKMLAGLAERELRLNGSGLEMDSFLGLPLGRILEEVAHLPEDTIVLYLTVFRDGAGESFKQPDVVQKVAAASGAPVYSMFGSYFGHGIVGGHIVSFEAAGDQAAAVALRLLSGEMPDGSVSPWDRKARTLRTYASCSVGTWTNRDCLLAPPCAFAGRRSGTSIAGISLPPRW